eukprot:scaffold416298_cov34-Prasinocladus_malaysianus.AAC.3
MHYDGQGRHLARYRHCSCLALHWHQFNCNPSPRSALLGAAEYRKLRLSLVATTSIKTTHRRPVPFDG